MKAKTLLSVAAMFIVGAVLCAANSSSAQAYHAAAHGGGHAHFGGYGSGGMRFGGGGVHYGGGYSAYRHPTYQPNYSRPRPQVYAPSYFRPNYYRPNYYRPVYVTPRLPYLPYIPYFSQYYSPFGGYCSPYRQPYLYQPNYLPCQEPYSYQPNYAPYQEPYTVSQPTAPVTDSSEFEYRQFQAETRRQLQELRDHQKRTDTDVQKLEQEFQDIQNLLRK